jgi:hypothetical protein
MKGKVSSIKILKLDRLDSRFALQQGSQILYALFPFDILWLQNATGSSSICDSSSYIKVKPAVSLVHIMYLDLVVNDQESKFDSGGNQEEIEFW